MNVSAGTAARILLQDSIANDLEAALVSLGGNIEARLRKVLQSDIGTLDPAEFEITLAAIKETAGSAEAVRLAAMAVQLDEIEQWIDGIGLDEAREKYFSRFGEVAEVARQGLAQHGINADALLDREGVRLAVGVFVERQDQLLFGGIRRTSAQRIGDALQANAELLSDDEFAERIADAYEIGLPHAKTEAITRIAEADRFIHEQMARESEEGGAELLRVYVGPVDAKTRPFCSALVGKAFTLEEIETLNNGQTGTAIDACGGYRCRHMWEAVPAELLDALGFVRGTLADLQQANQGAQRARARRRAAA